MKSRFDCVSAVSILNNDGYDLKIFKNMIECCKTNGFIVFATKLDFHQKNQYTPEIKCSSEPGTDLPSENWRESRQASAAVGLRQCEGSTLTCFLS